MNNHDREAMPEPKQMKKVAKYIGCRESWYAPLVINEPARVVMKLNVAIAINIDPRMRVKKNQFSS